MSVYRTRAAHLRDLFLFVQHCKIEGIKSQLKSFGRAITAIAIAKQEAKDSAALIELLVQSN
ncbi:MAG: hypothetical protein P8N47_00785 [Bacteroidia bacterium]|nr:hypothetical protein [Bacteroidia bacterium]